MNALAEPARRVAELDDRSRYPASGVALDEDLTHFIRILQQVVRAGRPPAAADAETVTVAEADRWQRRCQLLAQIAAHAPSLVDGPLDLGAQYWIATGRQPDSGAPTRQSTPSRSHFVPVAMGSGSPTGPKPFGVGLFTATATATTTARPTADRGGVHGQGMWRLFLAGYQGPHSMFPLPWHVWRLRPRSDARVYEVSDAGQWVRLITDFPRATDGYVHPDWPAVAAVYDAVHVTLRAIVAAQGLSFATGHGPTTPPYWDVEQTFWLRWCFDGADLVEVVGQDDQADRVGVSDKARRLGG